MNFSLDGDWVREKRAIVLFFFLCWSAFGVILHPEGEPDPMDDSWRPSDNVVGRFGSIACFEVIAPNWILTTRHQGTFPSTLIIAGETYYPQYNPLWRGGTAGNADIQIVRLTKADGSPAGLTDFAPVYDSIDEVGMDFVIGGFGDGRDQELTKNNIVYGYTWDRAPNVNQRWGTNRVDSSQDSQTLGIYTSDILIADFDGLLPFNTVYEAASADHDSGGGWFINVSGQWRLIGLNRAIEGHYQGEIQLFETWFKNNILPKQPDPDRIDVVRVSSYAVWINEIIHTPGDLTGDDWVDFEDWAFAATWFGEICDAGNNFCDGADVAEPFGIIDFADLAFIAENWLTGWE